MGLSMDVRPRVVEEGKVRLGFAEGYTRDVALDFANAKPATQTDTTVTSAFLTEISAFYGVGGNMDIGIRVRPLARGAKLEWQLQLLDPRVDAVGLAIGLGVDGFFRNRLDLGCEANGCFYREYGGAVADLPIVLSRRTWHWMTLFVAARPQYLFVMGQQTYEAQDGSFPTLTLKKTGLQLIGAGTAGILFEGRVFRAVPQVTVETVRGPTGKLEVASYPSIDFGFEF